MRKLLVYLKDYKKEAVLAPLFKMLEACLELLVPLVVAAIIDTGIGGGDKQYIVKMGLLMAALGLAGLISSVTAQYFAAKAAVNFSAKVRHALFEHIQALSYTQQDEAGTSTLITRLTSDINQVQSGVNMTLRLLMRSPFIVFGSMIMAFAIDVRAALVFVAAIVLLSIVIFGIMIACIKLYSKVQSRLDKVLELTRENLSGVRVIRAFCSEYREIDEFEKNNNALAALQRFTGKISALLSPLTFFIINIAIMALIYTGAIEVSVGAITQGSVVALYNYMSQILTELIKLADFIINLTKAVACGNRVQAALDIQPDIVSKDDASDLAAPMGKGSTPAVEFRHMSMRYKDAADYALEDISFSVQKGETVGIIGGTGSGKTTLVNMLPRFYDTESGKVLINGTDVRECSKEGLRGRIGIVPQKAVLFKGTIRENMRWGKADATDEEIYTALATAQAKDFVVSSPDGLSTPLSQGGRNLSGGQRQRLTIARALVGKPEILILDDSSSALDFATDAALRKALRQVDFCPTVFIVSQRASSIQFADKIVVLDDGKAVGIGTHSELLAGCEVYKEIYDSQYAVSD